VIFYSVMYHSRIIITVVGRMCSEPFICVIVNDTVVYTHSVVQACPSDSIGDLMKNIHFRFVAFSNMQLTLAVTRT